MAAQVPVLSAISNPVTVDPTTGIVRWTSQAKAAFDSQAVHETLRARAVYLTYDDGAYAAYAAMISDLDGYVGRVLAALDKAGAALREKLYSAPAKEKAAIEAEIEALGVRRAHRMS